ncbi:retinol dehydrogenase 12-like [Lytechinus pictus]|uniref:retinol dehydrogenase 12-like n=1 Tax=Lytechinus pictus TaxID=7653 RepID=UPI0030BA2981
MSDSEPTPSATKETPSAAEGTPSTAEEVNQKTEQADQTKGVDESNGQTEQTTAEQTEKAPEEGGVQETSPGPGDQVAIDAGKGAEASAAVEPQDDSSRVVIISGANTGIGLVASEKFAKDGFEVILACRSEEKANQAVSQVQKKVPGAKVSFMKLDLNSLKSVREFSDAFHATGKPLHALCNNAGLTTGFSSNDRLETEDGFEMTFGVNHLGHFLLTHLLMDVLKKTSEACGEARIVNTASMLHDPAKSARMGGSPPHLDFDDLMLEESQPFDGLLAYRNSKLANCAFSVELARRLEGSKVTSNTLCPGFIPATGLGRNETTMAKIKMAIFTPLLKLIGVTRNLEHGGGMIHYVATSPDFKGLSGKHSSDFKMMDSSAESRDPEVGKRLWDISADLVQYEAAKTM